MPARRRPTHPPRLLLVLGLSAVLVGVGGSSSTPAGPATAQGAQERELRRGIDRSRQREQSLAGAVARLAALEQRAQRALTLLEGRLGAVEAELGQARAQLERTRTRLAAARARSARLLRRLEQAQAALTRLLRARYMSDPPDLVTVVLEADGFTRLLEDLSFVRRVQDRDASLLQEIRVARRDVRADREALAVLVPRQAEAAAAVARRRDALATIRAAADRRRALLGRARAARLAALAETRADRRRSERALTSLRRERRRAAERALAALERQQQADARRPGPGGPWAIPYAIVECESGGQNLPPNAATASGYYQFIDSTWRGLGGSTPSAYLASKAEQDRLAAKLWDGGRGRGNWDCAALVGLG